MIPDKSGHAIPKPKRKRGSIMELTILGKNGPFPRAGGACSGYLLTAGDIRLVLDLGNGTLSRLFGLIQPEQISGILLSHLHSDHMSDMLILRYALQQYYARGRKVPIPLSVVAPVEPEVEFRQLSGAGVYDMVPARDGMRLHFGTLQVTLHRMIHSVLSFSMDISDGKSRLFYTGDSGYFEELPGLCRGADLLLADAGLLSHEKTTYIAPHMTAKEAGELARDAQVKQLVCTHIWGGYTDEQILSEAAQSFGNVCVAQEGATYSF